MRRLLLLGFLLSALPAGANGAFPDSLKLLLAPDRPDELILATNFGLVVSQDSGKSWRLHCEGELPSPSDLYERSRPPQRTILAPGSAGLGLSRDSACTWTLAGGTLAGQPVSDAFPDPSNPTTLYALAHAGPGGLSSIHRSLDDGATFGPPLLVAPSDSVFFSGVEVAPTDSQTLYATAIRAANGGSSSVYVTVDGGWEERVLTATKQLRLIGVDRARPDRLFLRVIDPAGMGESLGISDDGGKSMRLAFNSKYPLTSFLQRSDGALLVGTLVDGLFRSLDDGQTFAAVAMAPHARAIAERDGFTFVAGDDLRDGFALSRSKDDTTWEVLLRFSDICGPADCGPSKAKCSALWPTLAAQLGVAPGTCGRPMVTTDPPKPKPVGCGCSSLEGGSLFALWLLRTWLSRRTGPTRGRAEPRPARRHRFPARRP